MNSAHLELLPIYLFFLIFWSLGSSSLSSSNLTKTSTNSSSLNSCSTTTTDSQQKPLRPIQSKASLKPSSATSVSAPTCKYLFLVYVHKWNKNGGKTLILKATIHIHEMRLLKWSCGRTKLDRINEIMRNKMKISKKIVQERRFTMRWTKKER